MGHGHLVTDITGYIDVAGTHLWLRTCKMSGSPFTLPHEDQALQEGSLGDAHQGGGDRAVAAFLLLRGMRQLMTTCFMSDHTYLARALSTHSGQAGAVSRLLKDMEQAASAVQGHLLPLHAHEGLGRIYTG